MAPQPDAQSSPNFYDCSAIDRNSWHVAKILREKLPCGASPDLAGVALWGAADNAVRRPAAASDAATIVTEPALGIETRTALRDLCDVLTQRTGGRGS